MIIYSIYKIVNLVNDKVYIGVTNNFTRRYKRHISDSKILNTPLYRAIRKYGWDKFEIVIIYQSLNREHTIKSMENHFINEYKSYVGSSDCHGYNVTLGGEGFYGLKRTEEHKRKISTAHKGKPKSAEQIRKHVDSISKSYSLLDPNGNVIHIKNMSEYCRERNLNQSHMIGVYLSRPGFKSHKGYTKLATYSPS